MTVTCSSGTRRGRTGAGRGQETSVRTLGPTWLSSVMLTMSAELMQLPRLLYRSVHEHSAFSVIIEENINCIVLNSVQESINKFDVSISN